MVVKYLLKKESYFRRHTKNTPDRIEKLGCKLQKLSRIPCILSLEIRFLFTRRKLKVSSARIIKM
jgi:hypothetical protein